MGESRRSRHGANLDYELTGFVKLAPQGVTKKMSGFTIAIDCYATKALEIHGGGFLWRCGKYQAKP